MSNATIPQFEMRHRLSLALEVAECSVNEMAEVLGVSRNTVGNYLAGRTSPSTSVQKVWAMRCGVPYQWLSDGVLDLGGSDHPTPPPGWFTGDDGPGSAVVYLADAS